MSDSVLRFPETGSAAFPQTVLRAMIATLEAPDFAQAGSALASFLAGRTGCERVALGMQQGTRLRLAALSDRAEARPELELSRQIAAAMSEAAEQHTLLRHPPTPADPPRILLQHAALAATAGDCAVLSLPLAARGELVGVLCFLRDAARPWSDEECRHLEQLVALLGELLLIKQRAHESWRETLRRAPGRTLTHLRAPGSRGLRVALALGTLAALLLGLAPVSERISAAARIEGRVQRSIVAPVDGYIQDVLARPGTNVEAGKLLLSLADQDLRLEQSRLEAELARYRYEQADAFARQDRARMVGSGARSEEAAAQLQLVREQIERTHIRAPIDGMVIRGDQVQLAGAPVKRGDVLMVVAPPAEYRLVLQVQDVDISRVFKGQHGQVAFAALPGERFDVRVRRITPVAGLSEGLNCFEVEAEFDASNPEFRPGLEGWAHLDLGRRALAVQWSTRLAQWLDFRFWKLFG